MWSWLASLASTAAEYGSSLGDTLGGLFGDEGVTGSTDSTAIAETGSKTGAAQDSVGIGSFTAGGGGGGTGGGQASKGTSSLYSLLGVNNSVNGTGVTPASASAAAEQTGMGATGPQIPGAGSEIGGTVGSGPFASVAGEFAQVVDGRFQVF